MTEFPETSLLVVGRSVKYDGEDYYMNSSHRDLLEGMAEEFQEAIHLCQRKDVPAEIASRTGQIDESKIRIQANSEWGQASRVDRKYRSLASDINFIRCISGPLVTYTYYPGFYSFLLSPFVFRQGDLNIGHFGSDAIDTAKAAYTNSGVDRVKGELYRHFQSYVVNNIDCIFATDPRMVTEYDAANVRESKPLIEFSQSDFSEPATPTGEPIRLLTVGIFRPVKGYKYLIDALAHLVERSDHEYKLRMVGDGKTKPEIEQQVRSLGLENVVEFTGYVQDKQELAEHYEKADIFVLSSLKESVPRVLYEATLMGLPVVCTRVGGIPAFLEGEQHALLVDSGDEQELAEAIGRLGSDPGIHEQLVRNAQQKIEWYVTGDPLTQRMKFFSDQLASVSNQHDHS